MKDWKPARRQAHSFRIVERRLGLTMRSLARLARQFGQGRALRFRLAGRVLLREARPCR